MTARTLMIQGTASSVGKSILVTALCRILRQEGYRVAPFKAQNMALNSFVTREGGEIGRAQAVQAEAAGIEPTVLMNPVLLKPEAEARSQVIVLGKVTQTLKASQYYEFTPYLLHVIEDSLNQLRSSYDIVVIEGAGSPAEVNLKEKEIVNMRIARMAGAPVLLVGDIDRGGVFAALVGTLELLSGEERDLVRGLIINKFRGDINLLKSGLEFLEKKTGKPVLGVVPYLREIGIAQEDSVYLDERPSLAEGQGLRVAVVRLAHISNYDDFDPLGETGCRVSYVTTPDELAGADLIILPGTKCTATDLQELKRSGLAQEIIRQARSGTAVIGVCGGYQMLGSSLTDPLGVESVEPRLEGLGLLECETVFQPVKTTTQVKARVRAGQGLFKGLQDIEVSGYEIHMGQTTRGGPQEAFRVVETPAGPADYADGAVNVAGKVFGTYLHGLFHNPDFTRGLLNRLREFKGLPSERQEGIFKEKHYEALAAAVRASLDITRIRQIIFGISRP